MPMLPPQPAVPFSGPLSWLLARTELLSSPREQVWHFGPTHWLMIADDPHDHRLCAGTVIDTTQIGRRWWMQYQQQPLEAWHQLNSITQDLAQQTALNELAAKRDDWLYSLAGFAFFITDRSCGHDTDDTLLLATRLIAPSYQLSAAALTARNRNLLRDWSVLSHHLCEEPPLLALSNLADDWERPEVLHTLPTRGPRAGQVALG